MGRAAERARVVVERRVRRGVRCIVSVCLVVEMMSVGC